MSDIIGARGDGDDIPSKSFDREKNEKYIYLGVGVLAAGAIAVGAWLFFSGRGDAEHRREVKDAAIEGTLGERGFTAAGFVIDATGGAKELTIICPTNVSGDDASSGNKISYHINDAGDGVFLDVPAKSDINGQALGESSILPFSLTTSEDVSAFIDGELTQSCNFVLNN